MSASRSIDLVGGDVRAWIENDAVRIKAGTASAGPVELLVSDVRRLAEGLLGMADALEAQPPRKGGP